MTETRRIYFFQNKDELHGTNNEQSFNKCHPKSAERQMLPRESY